MKRSEVNAIIEESKAAFERHGWTLPPNPRWDVTDFGCYRFAERFLRVRFAFVPSLKEIR